MSRFTNYSLKYSSRDEAINAARTDGSSADIHLIECRTNGTWDYAGTVCEIDLGDGVEIVETFDLARNESKTFADWTCDSGHARVPTNLAGRRWITEANRIMALPDNKTTVALWDEHSEALRTVGGIWL